MVLNDNGATVGDVLGDGVVLSFSQPNVVGVFDVCLRLNTNPSKEYKKLDFGYSNDELKFIYPLGNHCAFMYLNFFNTTHHHHHSPNNNNNNNNNHNNNNNKTNRIIKFENPGRCRGLVLFCC